MKYQYLGSLIALIACALAAADVAGAIGPGAFGLGPQRHQYVTRHRQRAIGRRTVDPTLYPQYPANNISMPLDHFKHNPRYAPHSDAFFNARYWFDASYYKKGGPVIVLNSGEVVGTDRLPFLEKGIVAILAKATGGIGVILEHRFYGKSYPADLQHVNSTTLRFLSTEQAMADMAYFARNVVFPGFEKVNLTAPGGTPYIAYGGSYAGGVVAFTRKTYPDVYWGAISSSGVTHAEWDFWKYYDAARYFSPPGCAEATMDLTDVLDNILIGKKGTKFPKLIRNVYGLGNLTLDVDFASLLSYGVTFLQSLNWDPHWDGGFPDFTYYCNNVTARTLLYPELANRTADVQKVVEEGGHGSDSRLVTAMLNHIGWLFTEYVSYWVSNSANYTQDQWFGTQDPANYQNDSLDSLDDRAWAWQYCNEWGYMQTGSGVPADMKPLVSRLCDIKFASSECRFFFNRTQEANVTIINQYGGFNISYPRLALLAGHRDPWRQAGPLALGQPDRISTTDQPWILLVGGVHHWDENGANATETTATYPPPFVQATQAEEKKFVKAWLAEYAAQKGRGTG